MRSWETRNVLTASNPGILCTGKGTNSKTLFSPSGKVLIMCSWPIHVLLNSTALTHGSTFLILKSSQTLLLNGFPSPSLPPNSDQNLGNRTKDVSWGRQLFPRNWARTVSHQSLQRCLTWISCLCLLPTFVYKATLCFREDYQYDSKPNCSPFAYSLPHFSL